MRALRVLLVMPRKIRPVSIATGDRLRSLDYKTARRLLLAAGLVVLLATAAVMYIRRVDSVEVAAVLLFIVVFIGFILWNTTGGLVAALVATAVYVALRMPAIDAVGFDAFAGVIFSRAVAYLLFGAVGGIANHQLAASLTKLELYDQIDDSTGLYNARFFVHDTDLEISRSKRYQTIFSLSVLEIPVESLAGTSRRRRTALMKELARVLQDSVRAVDRVAHCLDGDVHRFGIVLPETAGEGAEVFSTRLAERVSSFLKERGAKVDEAGIPPVFFTYPEHKQAIAELREEFRRVDRSEHPAGPDDLTPTRSSNNPPRNNRNDKGGRDLHKESGPL